MDAATCAVQNGRRFAISGTRCMHGSTNRAMVDLGASWATRSSSCRRGRSTRSELCANIDNIIASVHVVSLSSVVWLSEENWTRREGVGAEYRSAIFVDHRDHCTHTGEITSDR